uniref:Uncharacterized protein n=1 Tax=Trichuris muris TaxID=70415 RepID=A0A5S6QDD6_TRIMR
MQRAQTCAARSASLPTPGFRLLAAVPFATPLAQLGYPSLDLLSPFGLGGYFRPSPPLPPPSPPPARRVPAIRAQVCRAPLRSLGCVLPVRGGALTTALRPWRGIVESDGSRALPSFRPGRNRCCKSMRSGEKLSRRVPRPAVLLTRKLLFTQRRRERRMYARKALRFFLPKSSLPGHVAAIGGACGWAKESLCCAANFSPWRKRTAQLGPSKAPANLLSACFSCLRGAVSLPRAFARSPNWPTWGCEE